MEMKEITDLVTAYAALEPHQTQLLAMLLVALLGGVFPRWCHRRRRYRNRP
jgi:hypothetical protein